MWCTRWAVPEHEYGEMPHPPVLLVFNHIGERNPNRTIPRLMELTRHLWKGEWMREGYHSYDRRIPIVVVGLRESTVREWTPPCFAPTPPSGVHRPGVDAIDGSGAAHPPGAFLLDLGSGPCWPIPLWTRWAAGGRRSTCPRSGAGTGDQSCVPVSVRWSSASWIRASTAAWRFSSTPSRWWSSGPAAI